MSLSCGLHTSASVVPLFALFNAFDCALLWFFHFLFRAKSLFNAFGCGPFWFYSTLLLVLCTRPGCALQTPLLCRRPCSIDVSVLCSTLLVVVVLCRRPCSCFGELWLCFVDVRFGSLFNTLVVVCKCPVNSCGCFAFLCRRLC